MPNGSEMKQKFWDALDDSPFVMLGLTGVDDSHSQPMTAQFDDDLPNRLYFFTAKSNRLVQKLTASHSAILNYAAKDHTLFASVHGQLVLENDRTVIDRFWSPVVAAWYKEGKDDSELALLRFDAGRAEIWQSTTTNFLKYMAAGLIGDSAADAAGDDVQEVYF